MFWPCVKDARRVDQAVPAQSGIEAVRALRRGSPLLHEVARLRFPWHRAMRPEFADRSQLPRQPRCRSFCLPGSRTEPDRGQGRTRPAISYPGWACATDDRGGTGRCHGGGDKGSGTRERSLCVPLQSVHTSIASSLHRLTRRITTTDAGLVGDDNDRPAQLVSPKAGQFENSRNEFELGRPMDVPTVNIDHAVAVKKKCTALHRCANTQSI